MEQNEQPNFKKKAVMIGKKQIEHWHVIALVLIIYDYVAVCAAYFWLCGFVLMDRLMRFQSGFLIHMLGLFFLLRLLVF